MIPPALQERIQHWMLQHVGVFQLEPTAEGVRLVEVATGKALLLDAGAVLEVESRANAHTGHEYLIVQRQDRGPLALADAGFVFNLDTRSTGPLAGAPPVMSFRDFRRLYEHLRHLLEDARKRQECLDLMMILIAALDGARAAGLSTAIEEGELDVVLRRLESGS